MRPGTFGFYGTTWRRWPGQGVVPASHTTDAAPALPPRSEVPGAGEESFRSKAGDLPEPAADEDRKPARALQRPKPSGEPAAPEPAPEPESEAAAAPSKKEEPGRLPPRDEQQAPEPPAAETAPAERPEAKPVPKPRPEDEDLFDEKAARARRRFPVAFSGREELERTPDDSVTPTSLERVPATDAAPRPQSVGRRPTPKPVPRVPFDPRAEGRTPTR